MTTWTRVEDPTTLKAGDKVKIVGENFVVETSLYTGVKGPDSDGDYEVGLAWPFSNGEQFYHQDSTQFFRAEVEFLPCKRLPNEGEVFEDQSGRLYMLNPMNKDRVIVSTGGASLADMAYTLVRVVH